MLPAGAPAPGEVRALVLTGGASRRMGRHKPAIAVDGVPMVARVLAAAAAYRPVVVGSADGVPAGVPVIADGTPGAGPVAAIDTGLCTVAAASRVLLLAADLPRLTAAHLAALARAGGDCAVTVRDGRAQWLCAAWSAALLADRLAAEPARGRSMRSLYAGLVPVEVPDPAGASVDVDTPADLSAL